MNSITLNETQNNIISNNMSLNMSTINTTNLNETNGINSFEILSIIWLIGFSVFFSISLNSMLKLSKKLKLSIKLEENIYLVDNLQSPIIWGIFNPNIYIPSDIKDFEISYVFAHEIAHIKRFDHLARFLAYFTLLLHWFNPLVWIAFILSEQDMEISIDEKVLNFHNEITYEERQKYANSLLHFALRHKISHIKIISPIAFGQGYVKERILNIMNINKKKKTKTITVITLIFTFIVGLTMLLGASEKPIPVGVIESTQQVNLNEFNGRDISEIEYISIIMHTNYELISDVEQALNNSSLYSINFDKGTPEFNEFIEIYSSYTLNPIKVGCT